MRKPALILAMAFAFTGASTLAVAADEPTKKAAADADSSQPLSDTWITAKVKASLLADDDVSGLAIEVDTVDGVVFLTGKVANQAQAAEAKRLAAEVEGVGRVDDGKLVVSAD
jgi:hyperosmotically inducible protein